MSSKGTKDNPYNLSELPSNDDPILYNRWPGGWVLYPDDTLHYIDHNHLTYNSSLGDHEHPFSQEIYEEMIIVQIWTGGWVTLASGKVYITRDGMSYAEEANRFGFASSPYPFLMFEDICRNGMWKNGWVEFSTDDIRYIQNLTGTVTSTGEGCGSDSSDNVGSSDGCGCSSDGSSENGSSDGGSSEDGSSENGGSESSSDGNEGTVHAGSVLVATLNNGRMMIYAHWTDGKPFSNPMSRIRTTVVNSSANFSLLQNSLATYWQRLYTFAVTGDIYYTFNDHSNDERVILKTSLMINDIAIPSAYIE